MFLFIIFALASAFKVIQVIDSNQIYIDGVTQSQFNETYIFLTDGSVDYYYFQIYLSTIYETVSVALAASQIQAPYFDSSNKLIYEQFDTNGYLLKKQYLYLTLTKSTLPYFITILSDKQITYNIKAYQKYSQPCSESCSLLGSCYLGQCICKAGWIGDDCTISVNHITKELTTYKSGYFFQEFKEEESINFDITSFTDGNIYFLFETTQLNVPTAEAFDFKLELMSKVPQKFSLYYPISGPHKVIIYVPSSVKVKFNSNSQDESTIIDQSSSDNNSSNQNDSNNSDSTLSPDSVIVICVIVPLSIMVLITIVIYVKCRSKFKRFQIAPQIHVNQQVGPIYYGAYPMDDGECCICLGGFNNPQDLRRTPCNHNFHLNCIETWMIKGHTQCPMCRAEITMNSLI